MLFKMESVHWTVTHFPAALGTHRSSTVKVECVIYNMDSAIRIHSKPGVQATDPEFRKAVDLYDFLVQACRGNYTLIKKTEYHYFNLPGSCVFQPKHHGWLSVSSPLTPLLGSTTFPQTGIRWFHSDLNTLVMNMADAVDVVLGVGT